MRWTEAKYLEDPIECTEPGCTNTAFYWFDDDGTDEILFLCIPCVVARIIEHIRDEHEESGVEA